MELNKFYYILVFLIILVTPSILAETLCKSETVVPCIVHTPAITCDYYTYQVYNKDDVIKQNGTMSTIGDNIYKFTLDVPIANGYTIKICSNHTAQISVIPYESEDSGKGSIMMGLIFSQILIVLFFLYLGYVLGLDTEHDQYGNKQEKFVVLRLILILISMVWIIKVYSGLNIIIQNYIGIQELLTIAGLSIYNWIFFVFVSMYLFITLFYVLRIIKQNKINRINF